MAETLHVLSIGSTESCDAVRDALLLRHKCRLFVAASYHDLSAIPATEGFEVAVVHQTLSERELRISLERIRRYWPEARILLISAHSDSFNNPLYDEWARPGISALTFLETLERLAVDAKRKRLQLSERSPLRLGATRVRFS